MCDTTQVFSLEDVPRPCLCWCCWRVDAPKRAAGPIEVYRVVGVGSGCLRRDTALSQSCNRTRHKLGSLILVMTPTRQKDYSHE